MKNDEKKAKKVNPGWFKKGCKGGPGRPRKDNGKKPLSSKKQDEWISNEELHRLARRELKRILKTEKDPKLKIRAAIATSRLPADSEPTQQLNLLEFSDAFRAINESPDIKLLDTEYEVSNTHQTDNNETNDDN